jgi:hypothetical protein
MRLITKLSVALLTTGVSPLLMYPQDRPAKEVRATTRIVSQRYCAVDDEIASLGLTLRTTLVNGSTSALKVAKNFYPKLLVARTLRDSKMRRYELEQHGPEKIVPDPGEARAAKEVQVLPGESLESVTEVFVAVPVVTSNVPIDALPPGKHYLQADVQVLIADAAQPKYRNVISTPVAFEVDTAPQPIDCSEKEQSSTSSNHSQR